MQLAARIVTQEAIEASDASEPVQLTVEDDGYVYIHVFQGADEAATSIGLTRVDAVLLAAEILHAAAEQ